MKGNVETLGDGLPRYRIMSLPLNLCIKVVAIGIEVPPSNTNDRILVGAVDNLHVTNRRITNKSISLFIEVESQPGFRFFSRLHGAADWCRRAYKVIAWWVRSSMRYKFIKVLKL